MNPEQIIQLLICIILSNIIIQFRNSLRHEQKFTEKWKILSALTLGICMGCMADAIIIPSRITLFGLTTIIVTIVYTQASIIVDDDQSS